jgi:methionine-rich copper-binding protein CopC
MKLAYVLGAWLLLVAGTSCAQAHARLQQSVPADGSTLTSAPAGLVLRFSESVRLASLWIAREEGSRQKLVSPVEPQTKIAVALPPLVPGRYVVGWRAVGADGHVVPGQIRFTLAR